jgi:hypothetical protein
MRHILPLWKSRRDGPGTARPASPARAARAACVVVLLFAGPTLAESISGVCPDGSIFIVQSAAAIPCGDARQVAPENMPPIKPQYLPRPYAWQVFQARQDPNNPYNLVGEAAAAVAGPAPPSAPGPGASPQAPAPAEVAAVHPPPPSATPEPHRPTPPSDPLGLSNDEIRALVSIVELSQTRAPATLTEPDDADPELLLRLARSPAFEARLRDAWAAAGQPVDGIVVVFAAEARSPYAFHANLTFAQGHVAFHPDPSDRRQFGLLRGREGELHAGEMTLGYVVLPDATDPSEPMDIYWNDRRITAVLAPAS